MSPGERLPRGTRRLGSRGALVRLGVLAILALVASGCDVLGPIEPPPAACSGAGSRLAASVSPLPGGSPYDAEFEAAGRAFGVPPELLRVVGWTETRWQMVEGREEFPGRPPAFGVMALRGDRLAAGARLAGVSERAARTEPSANIRAAAALLDSLARASGVDRSGGPAAWAPAVASYGGIQTPGGRAAFLRGGVYAALGVSLPEADARAARASPAAASLACPPAAPDDGQAVWRPSPNYDRRPSGPAGDPHMVIVHTCEGSYAGCWSWLANTASGVSSHYVVSENGGEISQLVREADRAWHIAATYDCSLNAGHDCRLNGVQANGFTVGIEHAGFASQDSFPAAQIAASAALVCRISQRLGIPRDFRHVVGHGRLQPDNRTDPGGSWPWTAYITSIQRDCGETVVDDSSAFLDGDVARVEAPASWTATDQTPGYYAAGYRWTPTSGADDDPMVFSFRLGEAGTRSVDVRWTEGSNRSPAARYLVVGAAGDTLASVQVDQRTGGGDWHELGSWSFPAGWNRIVLSRLGPSGTVVVGDAVRVR